MSMQYKYNPATGQMALFNSDTGQFSSDMQTPVDQQGDPGYVAPVASAAASGGQGGGLTGSDWAGLGMQIGGALISDNNQKQQAAQAEKIRQEDIARQLQLGSQSRMDNLQQQAQQNAFQKRGQNMQGLNYLTSLSDSNRAEGRRHSFRDALLSGGR